jgi:hypothetical protein
MMQARTAGGHAMGAARDGTLRWASAVLPPSSDIPCSLVAVPRGTGAIRSAHDTALSGEEDLEVTVRVPAVLPLLIQNYMQTLQN